GRVGDAAVDVAVLLQGEAGRGIRAPVEDERRRVVHREGARAAHCVWNVACVNRAGLEAPVAIGTLPVRHEAQAIRASHTAPAALRTVASVARALSGSVGRS